MVDPSRTIERAVFIITGQKGWPRPKAASRAGACPRSLVRSSELAAAGAAGRAGPGLPSPSALPLPPPLFPRLIAESLVCS